jgi:hypothetical protein
MVGFEKRKVERVGNTWGSPFISRIRDSTKPVNEEMGILVSILSGSERLAPGGGEYCSSFSETPWILTAGIGMTKWDPSRRPVTLGARVRPEDRLRPTLYRPVYAQSPLNPTLSRPWKALVQGVCSYIEEEPGADPVEYCWPDPESINMVVSPVVKISDET